jgi:hypothetical protein
MICITMGLEAPSVTGLVVIDTPHAGQLEPLDSSPPDPALFHLAPSPGDVARITRSSMLEVLNKDYVKNRQSQRLDEMIAFCAALRNVSAVVTVLGKPQAFSAARCSRNHFSWPGLTVCGGFLMRETMRCSKLYFDLRGGHGADQPGCRPRVCHPRSKDSRSMSKLDPMRDLLRNRSAALGLALIALIVIVALIGPALAPYNPLIPSPLDRLKVPSSAHFFGTDSLGRDILSRSFTGVAFPWPSA